MVCALSASCGASPLSTATCAEYSGLEPSEMSNKKASIERSLQLFFVYNQHPICIRAQSLEPSTHSSKISMQLKAIWDAEQRMRT
eukprot:6203790-Pleurochrysis_carterae.AAC.3